MALIHKVSISPKNKSQPWNNTMHFNQTWYLIFCWLQSIWKQRFYLYFYSYTSFANWQKFKTKLKIFSCFSKEVCEYGPLMAAVRATITSLLVLVCNILELFLLETFLNEKALRRLNCNTPQVADVDNCKIPQVANVKIATYLRSQTSKIATNTRSQTSKFQYASCRRRQSLFDGHHCWCRLHQCANLGAIRYRWFTFLLKYKNFDLFLCVYRYVSFSTPKLLTS